MTIDYIIFRKETGLLPMVLERINSPEDVKKLDRKDLPLLAKDIRQRIIDVVSEKGGHLAPGLGAVELTIALHHVFNTPDDKIVWDVGHQSYGHKIITGRREQMAHLRQIDGISGFPKPTYARVLFFSIKDEGRFIEFIMRMLDKEFEQHNFKREESYIPHITFGRVKYGFVDLSSKKFSDIKFTVQAYGLTLIESVLNPEGPTYNEIKYFNFVNNNV